mgnify:CR=1 FL=1
MSGKANDGRAYTNSDAASALGIDQATVKRWRSRGWIVNRLDGSLDVSGTRTRASAGRDPTHGGRSDRTFGGVVEPRQPAPEPPRPRPESAYRQPAQHTHFTADSGLDMAVGDSARLLKARAISATADAKLKQLRIQERIGELIPRAAVTQAYADTLAAARSQLESLPTRLAHRLVGLDAVAIRGVLQTEIEVVLKELADGLDPDR